MGTLLAEGIPNVEIWKKEKKGKSEPSLYTKELSKPPPGLSSGRAVLFVPSFPVSAGFPLAAEFKPDLWPVHPHRLPPD